MKTILNWLKANFLEIALVVVTVTMISAIDSVFVAGLTMWKYVIIIAFALFLQMVWAIGLFLFKRHLSWKYILWVFVAFVAMGGFLVHHVWYFVPYRPIVTVLVVAFASVMAAAVSVLLIGALSKIDDGPGDCKTWKHGEIKKENEAATMKE